MKTFGVSDKHTGPWLGESEKPDQALAKGRAMWGNDCPLYLAVLDVMNPAEGLPSVEILFGEAKERLVEKYGSGADAVYDSKEVQLALSEWWYRVTQFDVLQIIEDIVDLDFMVASQIKLYSPGHDVKLGDYK